MLPYLTGCANDRNLVEQRLMATLRSAEVGGHYRVGCPDIVELSSVDRPKLDGRYVIAADGRIDLGDYGKLRIEGRTLAQVAELVATDIGSTPAKVQARISEFHGQHLLLFGEVIGHQRSVPYEGQETVLDLLKRVGGITADAAPRDVYVVRAHLGESQRPEVIHVDLEAIVMKDDQRTNIRLLPYDQIYVGETRRAQIEKAVPPWLRGFIPGSKAKAAPQIRMTSPSQP